MTTFTVINKRLANGATIATYTASDSVDISTVSGYSVHMIWTGTPTGTLSIKGSNDNSNFATVSTVSTGGAAGQSLTNVEKAHYNFLRVEYAHTSGAGNLTIYISGKNL